MHGEGVESVMHRMAFSHRIKAKYLVEEVRNVYQTPLS